MSEPYPKKIHKIGIFVMWFSIIIAIVAAIVLVYVYKSEALDYAGYYIAGFIVTVIIYGTITVRVKQNKPFKIIPKMLGMLWVLAIIGSGFYGIGLASIQIAQEKFDAAPFLTWTDDQDPTTEITVSWITSKNTTTKLQYGLSLNNLNETISDQTMTRYHHVAISNLTANTTYYYQVDPYSIKQFTTAPTGEFDFTYFFWVDHRTNSGYDWSIRQHKQPNVVEGMTEYIRSEGIDPAFSICAGDITSLTYDYQTWNTWFDDIAYNDWGSNKTVQMAFGNHERCQDNQSTLLKQYYPYEVKPDNHFYHSFDYGAVHFIILDPYLTEHSWSKDFTQEQLIWLENDLETHQTAKFTVIAEHPPVSTNDASGRRAELTRLAQQYKIDVLLCGHYHDYTVTTIGNSTGNFTEMIVGLGGNPNNEYSDYPCDTAFVRVDVTATQMKVKTVFVNGTVLDEISFEA